MGLLLCAVPKSVFFNTITSGEGICYECGKLAPRLQPSPNAAVAHTSWPLHCSEAEMDPTVRATVWMLC